MQGQNESKGGPYAGWGSAFFGVVARPHSWLSVGYQLLAFPLGLAYFVFLVVALSVGISLTIVMIGIPLLIVSMLFWRLLARFERLQARGLLGARVPSGPPLWRSDQGFWQNIKDLVGGAATWLDFVFLLLKFPVGIVSFVLSVTGLSIVVAFIGAPFMQQFGWFTIAGERVDSWPLALALVPVGILALFVWLHVMNAWGYVSARLAEALLVDEPEKRAEAAAAQPPAPQAPQVQAPVPPWQAPPQPWQQQPWRQQPWPLQAPQLPQAPQQAWPPQAPQAQQPWPPQGPWQPPQPWQQQPWQQPWGPPPWPPQAPQQPQAPQAPQQPQAPQAPQAPQQSQQPQTPQAPEAPQQPPAEAEAGPAANEPSDDN